MKEYKGSELMPLNAKGEKILASMEKQYGKKKGKTVFYAMENSGKLKGVKKAYSGDFMSASTSSSMYDSGKAAADSFQASYSGSDNGNNQPTTSPKTTGTTSGGGGSGPNLTNIGKSLLTMGASKLFDLPMGVATVAKKVVGPIQRAVTPKATKDIADARLSGSFTTSYNYQPKTIPTPSVSDSNIQGGCADGSSPPCKTPTTQIKNPVSTPNPFLSGFKAYDDGGEVVISSNVDKSLL
jgi:hypothetical protein